MAEGAHAPPRLCSRKVHRGALSPRSAEEGFRASLGPGEAGLKGKGVSLGLGLTSIPRPPSPPRPPEVLLGLFTNLGQVYA